MAGGVREEKKLTTVGALLVLISGISYAPVVVVGKLCIEGGVDEISLNLVRICISALLLGALFAATRRTRRSMPLNCKVIASIFGAIVYVVGGLCFFASLRYIDAALAYLVTYTYPAIVLTISLVLGFERFAWPRVVAVSLTFTGVALVLRAGGDFTDRMWLGVGFVMVTTLIFSVYVLVNDRLLSGYSSRQISFYSMTAAAALMLVIFPFTAARLDKVLGSLPNLGLVAIAGLGSGISLILFLSGIRHVGASLASVVSTVQPVFVVLLAWLVLGEAMGPFQMFGALLLIGGVLLARWERKKVYDATT
jgi:drug/metabolite transporter (DMT)-like permease